MVKVAPAGPGEAAQNAAGAPNAPRTEKVSCEHGELARAVRAVAILSRHFERACVEMNLSLPQYRLLLWVRTGPQRAAELATRAAVRRPTLTALVDGLEAEGLLSRSAVEGDRRGIRLEVTEKGLELLARTEEHLGHVLGRLAEGEHCQEILDQLALFCTVIEHNIARYRRENSKGSS